MSDPRRRYWRTLEEQLSRAEWSGPPDAEFPPGAARPPDGFTRRDFMTLLGASLALAGLSGCVNRPRQKILPYVSRPADVTPTVARHYATSMTLDGFATGLLVESHTGRPTKIEGNPDHPASLGAAGVFEQASVLGLYDPQRARSVRLGGRPSTWSALLAAIAPAELRRAAGERGAGLHLLLEPTASPFLLELLARARQAYPDAQVHWYAPLASDAPLAGARAAFGRPAQPVYDFTAADVVLALDADFLAAGPYSLRYAHDFAQWRHVSTPSSAMNRLYVIETAPTATGGVADHRLRARPSEIPALAARLALHVNGSAALVPQLSATLASFEPMLERTAHDDWLTALANDLLAHRGRCAIVAGECQPAAVHALAHLLNAGLGNVGHTVRYIEPPLPIGDRNTGLAALTDALRADSVACLVVLQGNPAYTAPPELDVPRLLAKPPTSVYLGLYRDETARACRWFVPAQHYLESWGDARAWDGTASLVQPLVQPLFGGHDAAELLAALAGESRELHAVLRDSWQQRWRPRVPAEFDRVWDETLQRGVISESAAPSLGIVASADGLDALLRAGLAPASEGRLELAFAPGATVHDGRFANNPWLQELPDPVTKLTWGNAALLSPRTAARLKVESGQLLDVAVDSRQLSIPALVVPGHADDTLTISLGYGRPPRRRGDADGAEQVAAGVGANAYVLRALGHPYGAPRASVRPLADGRGRPRRARLAVTQSHWEMQGRPIVLSTTLDEFRRHPVIAPHERGRPLTLYEPARSPAEDQWAMTIDLSACTGCSACVVACQAENNVPVVGAEGVQNSREMHWLRIDRYYTGTPDDPVPLSQPMLCQHCEKAPCEYVCPVSATVHSPDGINEMVYNRCVGTRFCSNNCPYKVRRFNWFNYNAEVSETERLAKNPDVSVRARGVMEKCTFCVQRIREAQIGARLENRSVRAGEVRTACQQACPTGAIVFGSLTNPDDEVRRWRENPRAYAVLHELGTEPRVRYLARIT
ncbi:MAG TPA: TAT-variant-translocated molybdopterin oxidoreductase, partial [Gemmatimonadales bacterium]|nr:TAT-variant-translocated molybdopterin oxidoreductase [Gemmatimonadales bacterium]